MHDTAFDTNDKFVNKVKYRCFTGVYPREYMTDHT